MNKILKSFAVCFVSLFLITLIVAAFLPKSFDVTREIEIHAPRAKVFPLVADFSNWKQWGPWFEAEPTAEYKIEGNPGEIGSSISWSGRIIGRGTMRIEKMIPSKELHFSLELMKPNYMKLKAKIKFNSVHLSKNEQVTLDKLRDESTNVMWTNSGELPYPGGRLFGPFLGKGMETDLMRGLTKLKTTVEQTPTSFFEH